MFRLETTAFPLYARLCGSKPARSKRAPAPDAVVCAALAEMVPSTAAEVAAATGLDAATVDACLDRLAAGYRVMFNPLTKRYSLPPVSKIASGLAA